MNKYAFIPVTLLITSIIVFTSLKEKPSYISIARTVEQSRFTADYIEEPQSIQDFANINIPEMIPIADISNAMPQTVTLEEPAKTEKSEASDRPAKAEKAKKKQVKTNVAIEAPGTLVSEEIDNAAAQEISTPDTSQAKTPEVISQEPVKEKKKKKKFLIFKNKDQ
jgi:hypothetical protein